MKVRLLDVVAVPEGHWQQHGTKGSGMHCDLVLADRELVPRLVIELDARSHAEPEDRKRDAFRPEFAARDIRVGCGPASILTPSLRVSPGIGEVNIAPQTACLCWLE